MLQTDEAVALFFSFFVARVFNCLQLLVMDSLYFLSRQIHARGCADTRADILMRSGPLAKHKATSSMIPALRREPSLCGWEKRYCARRIL